ncbi:MAG TPA: phosphatidylglycerophosphatase A [Bacteroidota bacterium]|nr:phosphatidylglycerophosphatase A [Bacteroidota bacterium]
MPEPQKLDNRTEKSDVASPSPAAISPLVKLFASGLYSGFSPIASGTVGTLVGLLIYLIPSFADTPTLLASCVVVFILGGLAAGKMETVYGHDPSAVTIDEVLGIWISLLLLPKTFLVVVGAFFLFRAFDVFKPWPARAFDRMNGGWNIMLDDVVAGIYANLVLQVAIRFLQ